MLKLVFGDAAVTIMMVYKWSGRFYNGCELSKTRRDRGVLQHKKSKSTIHFRCVINNHKYNNMSILCNTTYYNLSTSVYCTSGYMFRPI
jgi:hypothetical protein